MELMVKYVLSIFMSIIAIHYVEGKEKNKEVLTTVPGETPVLSGR
jgi:hypothetical protein